MPFTLERDEAAVSHPALRDVYKRQIESMDQAQFRYFVRVAGSCRNKEQDVKNAFGPVEVIELYGMDEFAFLTAQMTEGEFKKGAVSYDARERERFEYGIKQLSLIHI